VKVVPFFVLWAAMKIALITEPEKEFGAGVGRYSRSLVSALLRLRSPHHLLLVSGDHANMQVAPGTATKLLHKYYHGPGSTYLWYLSLPFRLEGADLVHNLSQIPTCFSFTARTVITIHDLSPLSLPHTHRPLKSWIYRALLPPTLRKAKGIIAVSETTRQELVRFYPGTVGKIWTIPHGVDPLFRVIQDERERERVRKAYRLDTPFFLTVGQIERRKNLVQLIMAFAKLRGREDDHCLVLIGRSSFRAKEVYRAIARLGLEDRVRILGTVPDQDLAVLYNLATLLVFPSLYEGFGLPALEAMACGLAVCAARAGALLEVVGDAGMFFDPYNVEEMAEVLWCLLKEPDLRQELAIKGLKRAEEFSWERCAAATLQVYDELLSRK